MVKQLVIISSVVFILGVMSFAQEKPKQEKMEKPEKIEKQDVQVHEKVTADSVTIAEGPWNKLCPVMGNKVDPEVPTIEYEGKAYGFCCPGCDDKFRNDPEKYSKNLSEDGTKFIGKKSRH